jgi:Fanconi anemia group M protein
VGRDPDDRPAPEIIVDIYEPESRIAEYLEELGASVEFRLLDAGDYVVGEGVLVERKRVLDLHVAIVRGRLWRQIGQLRSSCRRPYLLIEGTDLGRGPLHIEAVRGAYLAVLDQGIGVLRSDHQRDRAAWLYRMAVRRQHTHGKGDKPVYAQRPKDRLHPSEAVLSSVPGISVTTASALLRRFGSVSAIVAASPADWMTVKGVGEGRAEALRAAFGSPPAHEASRSMPSSSLPAKPEGTGSFHMMSASSRLSV